MGASRFPEGRLIVAAASRESAGRSARRFGPAGPAPGPTTCSTGRRLAIPRRLPQIDQGGTDRRRSDAGARLVARRPLREQGEPAGMDDEMREVIDEFLVESNENLDQLDRDFVTLERAPGDLEVLASVFRTIHTIK